MSPFAEGPFVKVNCGAIPADLVESELFGHEKGAFTGATSLRRGKFELADGGYIFLDEVADLQESSQSKLLRVLQDGEFHRVGGERNVRVSVRVISATNRDLRAMVAKGEFREDLFYRISVVPIVVPPLRERREDIPDLVMYFLREFCERNNFKAKSIDDSVLGILGEYAWPGNVRELKNIVERMAILSPGTRISDQAVPLEIRTAAHTPVSSLQEIRDAAEREQIQAALEASDWNVTRAARALGIERTNLHKRIRALGLSKESAAAGRR
jgi:two-component system nitrogen regulation response regulator NtrX